MLVFTKQFAIINTDNEKGEQNENSINKAFRA